MNFEEIRDDSGHQITYQDLLEVSEANKGSLVAEAIRRHTMSKGYRTALDADLYDKQKNPTINRYVQKLFDVTGSKLRDFTASNNKLASNFFHRLNTQRVMYSLGSGVSFVGNDESGEDTTKQLLGPHFDHDLQSLAYNGLIHGVSFGFWNMDRLHVFPLTEFCPFWDETNGSLGAGARFWWLNDQTEMYVVLYEPDGYTKFVSINRKAKNEIKLLQEKRPYMQTVQTVPFDGSEEVIAEENYGSLPIVPMWGSRLHQSTLVGMQQAIDSYDLIRSGFANDLTDCSQVYWLLSNAGGMDDKSLQRFLDRLKINHVAVVDADEGSNVQGFTQEIPYNARKEYLTMIRDGIYEDFGALDVHTVAAGATNDHIDAAYQPMDEEAADFEFQVSEFVQQLLSLLGIEDTPVFQRTRISNQKEQVETVLLEAPYLDDESILRLLPNIPADMVQAVLDRKDNEAGMMAPTIMEEEPTETEAVE